MLFLFVFLRLFKKIIIQIYKMIKNKILYIKIIFKTYLKILKQITNILNFQIIFCSIKHHIMIFKNYFLELFLKTIIKHTLIFFFKNTFQVKIDF